MDVSGKFLDDLREKDFKTWKNEENIRESKTASERKFLRCFFQKRMIFQARITGVELKTI